MGNTCEDKNKRDEEKRKKDKEREMNELFMMLGILILGAMFMVPFFIKYLNDPRCEIEDNIAQARADIELRELRQEQAKKDKLSSEKAFNPAEEASKIGNLVAELEKERDAFLKKWRERSNLNLEQLSELQKDVESINKKLEELTKEGGAIDKRMESLKKELQELEEELEKEKTRENSGK